MKQLALFLLVFLTWNVLFAQQEFMVQGNHSGQISNSALDGVRGVLVTTGGNDSTLKFWNEKTGLLYKTIDLKSSISSIQMNEKDGRLYTLGNNTITVYSTTSFEKITSYQLDKIYAINYTEINGQGALTLLARDQNYMTSLFMLNEATGEFVASNIPPIPSEIEINRFEYSNDGKFIFITPGYGSYLLYDIDQKEYIELKGDYIAMFDNGDVLRAVYEQAEKKALYMRMNPKTRQVIWNTTFTWEEEIEGMIAPTVYDAIKSKDGKRIWVHTYTVPLTQLDAKTGSILGSFEKDVDDAYSLLDNNKSIYVQLGYENRYAKYKLYDDTPIVSYGYKIIEPTETIGFQNGDAIELIFSSHYGKKTHSLFAHPKVTQFTTYRTNYRDDFSAGKLVADVSSDKVFTITSTVDPIKVFHRGKANSFEDLIENKRNVQQYDYSPHTKLLATLSSRGLRVINTETASEIIYQPLDIQPGVFEHMLSIAPFNNAVAYTSSEVLGDQIMYQKLHYFDFGSKTEKWTKKGKYFGIFHINGGKELLATNGTTGEVQIMDVQTGNVLSSFSNGYENIMMNAYLSPNEEYLLYAGFNPGISVFHIPSKKKIKKFDTKKYSVFNGGFVTDKIVAFSESGAIKFLDVTNEEEVLRLYIFEDESWVAYTPEGLFDGSQEGWDKVAFINGQKTIPLESVFDQFYTPRLVNQVLANVSFKSEIDIESIASPPTVTIQYQKGTRNLYVEDDTSEAEITVDTETGTILLEANPNEDAIQEIRLYQNGKLVGNNTRNLFVEDDVNQDPNRKELQISLIPGLNEFSAVAINSQGTESVPKKLNVNYMPSQQSLIKPQGIQAHILVIGIDEYQNPKYNLNYAVADATGFQNSLQEGLINITSKTHVYFIKNKEAIRENIVMKLNEIAAVANPQDIFIFYYAGHGVVLPGNKQEFYLVPSDVTQLYGDDGAIQQKGISASELKKIASGIVAQKQLYLLDACQSAGALTTLARGAAEEKAIAQLARSTGTHWLTASGSQQFATEFDELGHGVFTYALLEALSGKADSGDQRVTVNELKAYLESRVPEISEKYKGSPQYPSSFGFGQDFPVSVQK